ncbi:MAG: DedA family protein [bacterium]|nr:DedA family protein [bacterium]
MITQLFEILLPYKSYSYFLIIVLLLACGLGLPIPEDITLVVGGLFASYNVTNFWLTVLVAMIGVLGGDSIIFMLGKFLGSKVLKSKFLSRIVKPRSLAKVKLASAKYGNYLLFFARFMPGFRAPVYFSMGMFKKSFLSFILIDGFAAVISVPLWVYVGMLFGNNIPVLEHHIKHMQMGIYIVLAVVIVGIIIVHLLKKNSFPGFYQLILMKMEI